MAKISNVLLVVSLLGAIGLTACDQSAGTDAKTEPPKIFKEELQALDKAKGVQNIIDRQAEDMHKKIDEPENNQ